MIYFSALHWIIVLVFICLFIVLSLLALKEKKQQTIISMIIASFIVNVFAAVISLYVVDKYTKKVKIVTYKIVEDKKHESVIVRGSVKNVGRYEVGYCTLQLRMSNNIKGRYAKTSYFTPNASLDFFSSKKNKKNIVKVEKDIVHNLAPKERKKFVFITRIPSHFQGTKFKLQLFCH